MKIPVNFFFHISCHQLSTTIKHWWQLIIGHENQPRELKFGAHIILRVYIKLIVQLFLYQLSTALNSCLELIITDENEHQPKELIFSTHITIWIKIKLFFFTEEKKLEAWQKRPAPLSLVWLLKTFWVLNPTSNLYRSIAKPRLASAKTELSLVGHVFIV